MAKWDLYCAVDSYLMQRLDVKVGIEDKKLRVKMSL